MSLDPDKFLIRTNDNSVNNLCVGEPYFLRKHMEPLLAEYTEQAKIYSYPQHGGNQELLEELRALHPGKYICIANGAKQALLAAFYALKIQKGLQEVIHEAPYWPPYPTLAALSGLRFSYYFSTYGIKPEDKLVVITSPNNPDASECSDKKQCHVWDAVYASDVYGWNRKQPVHHISIWSASKMLGISGDRIGWLATTDKELWQLACDYIEKTTSGVSVSSQNKCAWLLKQLREQPKESIKIFKNAHRDLSRNGSLFSQYLRRYMTKTKGLPETKKGMFAWLKPDDKKVFQKAIEQEKIVLLPGEACQKGLDGWYRMSLGLETSKLEEIFQKLHKRLSEG